MKDEIKESQNMLRVLSVMTKEPKRLPEIAVSAALSIDDTDVALNSMTRMEQISRTAGKGGAWHYVTK